MGGLPAIESLQRTVLPDTPPELASPSTSSLSSRSSPSTEQAAWGPRAPLFTPMPNYDKAMPADLSIDGGSETGRPSVETGSSNSMSRQQLPSLSSLFGPPSVRSLHSPRLDRPGSGPGPGSYLSHSPLDRPRVSSSGSSSGSYFPPALSPPASQPRSTYDVKYDAERTHQLAPTSYPGAGSPGYRDMGHRPDSRFDSESPNRWSMHPDSKAPEYSLGSRDGSYRSPRDKFRSQYPGPKDSTHDYHEHRSAPAHPPTSNPPPTAASAATAELAVSVSKDGLGPKIWTGTHFLPRFVRAAEVPGEGLCYFYDDGSHCKTVIDGEAVNAHWGVTKAGKPRKRLAIACVTCREKKIKCDPDYPRCVQCEKFGRHCKFKNAPRGGNNTSPSTPPAELDDGVQPNGGSSKAEMRRSVSDMGSPASPRAGGVRPASPEEGYGGKRLKVGPESYVPNGEPSTPYSAPLDHSKSQMHEQRPPPEMPRIPDELLGRAWRTDPYSSDPRSIIAALTEFFAQVDNTMILRLLPEDLFKTWVATTINRKNLEDAMLLYSTLAVGVALSNGPKHIAFEYAQVAHFAQKTLGFNCLQLVQSRILLAVYYIATCRQREAEEILSSAIATATCLQLGEELHHSRESSMSTFPLGLNRAGYCEARRRAFWSLFSLERLSGFFPIRPAMINPEDVYVRLPMDIQGFEKMLDSQMPMFDPHTTSLATCPEKPMDNSAYLIEMTHLWSESQVAMRRMVHRASSMRAESAKLHHLMQRTEDWQDALPARLAFGGSSLESAAYAGTIGSFLSMHLLYHHTMIMLKRYRYGSGQMTSETRDDQTQGCKDHAGSIVHMLKSLDRILRVRPTILSTPPPVMAVAGTEAVDVLTATGPMATLADLIESVRTVKIAVDKMMNVWEASSRFAIIIDRRLQKLHQIRDRGSHMASPNEGYRLLPGSEETRDLAPARWQITDPLNQVFPRDMDLVYFAP